QAADFSKELAQRFGRQRQHGNWRVVAEDDLRDRQGCAERRAASQCGRASQIAYDRASQSGSSAVAYGPLAVARVLKHFGFDGRIDFIRSASFLFVWRKRR